MIDSIPSSESDATIIATLHQRLLPIHLLAFDIDGVLTNGGLYMSEDSEILRFDVKDGAALSMAIRAGYPVALISGRDSAVAKRRAKMLNISHVLTGVSDKRAALVGLMEKLRLETSQVMFMGDDILDLPAFDVAGFKACPADAAEDVVSRATYRCSHRGGRGAVREIVEMVMRAQGTWQAAIERIVNESSPVVQ